LLSFENGNVLPEHAGLLGLEARGEADVQHVEIAGHAPEVMSAGVILRSHRIYDESTHSLIVLLQCGSSGNRGDADIDEN